jgi:hypothetical protein
MNIKIMSAWELESLGTPLPRADRGARLFFKNNLYYKIWGIHSNAFFILNGLTGEYQSHSTISALSVGLLNNHNCSALQSLIHNEDGICIGYTMFAGNTITTAHKLYDEFIDNLVDHSIRCGYALSDRHISNFIERNGKLSLIDVSFTPVLLNHGRTFTKQEYQIWSWAIHCGKPETMYYAKLKERYLDSLYKKYE